MDESEWAKIVASDTNACAERYVSATASVTQTAVSPLGGIQRTWSALATIVRVLDFISVESSALPPIVSNQDLNQFILGTRTVIAETSPSPGMRMVSGGLDLGDIYGLDIPIVRCAMYFPHRRAWPRGYWYLVSQGVLIAK